MITMKTYELNQEDLKKDGRIILYQRPRDDGSTNPFWWMRISVPNSTGYFRATTKEKNKTEAKRTALNKYEELYMRVLNGSELNATTFKTLYEGWKNEYPKIAGGNRNPANIKITIDRLGKYPFEFFVKVKKNISVEKISAQMINQYWDWRRENSYRPTGEKFVPSPNTLRKEATLLGGLFRYAKQKEYLKDIPEIPRPSGEKNRRPTFTLREYRTLTRKMTDWVKSGRGTRVYRDRFVLQQYVLVLANIGARVGEIRGLKWEHLRTIDVGKGQSAEESEGQRLVAYLSGKTGERESIFNEGSEEYIKRLFDFRKEELGEPPPLDSLVFCHKNGTPIGSMKKGWNSLMSHAGLERGTMGGRRTIYSLRHFYATQRLQDEVSPYLLAKQMGTSIKMLESHYGQVVNTLVAREITKTSTQVRKKSKDGSYPFMNV